MHSAIPRRYSARELGLRPDAPCALCGTREADTSIEREWVLCPLVGGQPIDLGCCLDYQGLARAEDFESDVYRGLFDQLSSRTGRSVDQLRLECLEHQQEIIGDRLSHGAPADQNELIALAGHVSRVAASVKP